MLCTCICAKFGLCLLDNFMHGYLCVNYHFRVMHLLSWIWIGLDMGQKVAYCRGLDWIGWANSWIGLEWIFKKMDFCATVCVIGLRGDGHPWLWSQNPPKTVSRARNDRVLIGQEAQLTQRDRAVREHTVSWNRVKCSTMFDRLHLKTAGEWPSRSFKVTAVADNW